MKTMIDYVAALAKLQLTDEEKERAKVDLDKILAFMEIMNELDTSGMEPMSHAFKVTNVFREDIIENGDDRENILANAPAKKEGCFVVPKTVE